ncbi:MAG: regulatory protein RecX [Lachnospiraceae bacterium]|nr:regulatory protein RecX [Lachnospiraceae bacterium]
MEKPMDDENLKATKKAMSLLQHMDRTEWELRSKLKQSGFSEEAVEKAVAYVGSYHYIDDERYARRFVDIYRQSRSMQRIRRDLQKRHVPESLIDQAIEEVDGDDGDALTKALDKLLRGKTELPYEEQQKVMAKLYRRGFRVDDIIKQIDIWREHNEF